MLFGYVRGAFTGAVKRREGRFRVVALGRLHPVKGFDVLLEAWARCGPAFPEWELTIFGEGAGSVTVTSNKSMLGHTLGAAGAIEAIITIQSIREGCVPPTINLVEPDPEGAGLDLVAGVARRQDIPIAMSNSFGFGGQNTALILRRWTE